MAQRRIHGLPNGGDRLSHSRGGGSGGGAPASWAGDPGIRERRRRCRGGAAVLRTSNVRHLFPPSPLPSSDDVCVVGPALTLLKPPSRPTSRFPGALALTSVLPRSHTEKNTRIRGRPPVTPGVGSRELCKDHHAATLYGYTIILNSTHKGRRGLMQSFSSVHAPACGIRGDGEGRGRGDK